MDKILVTIIAGLLVGFIVWWFFGKHVTKEVAADVTGNEQDVSVVVNGGYTPSTVVLKRGIPAQITFNRKDPSSCLEQVVFEDFGINDFLPQNKDHAIDIDTSKPGEYNYACGMNMFHGKVIVK
ncbi:cupredoxin domain-containing protein [Loigolactobacillus coryniformis]|jgi:plastocyanin domain-containing protein|uniref:cupredoxin domain-containing protein n=1 Tax=Lactobacillaceae TaxID=33958 RepID=UPI000CFB2AB9|nr:MULTISPECIES: cupredoxin domain-containing protein [Lactobacillaceae]AVK64664.1 copper-binding protein [Lactobacillus sp. CBA3606]MBW4801825.1 cupredoxin domain-containing protein [Loigolactobacillus coryniformis subsp. torquens]MBW4804526.1 cupredoxin domain-containing protein [Loigolactobacillus coryniformis subsp. torquens]